MIETEQDRANWRLYAKAFSEQERGHVVRERANAKMQNVHKEDMTQGAVQSCAVQFGATLWSANIREAVERQDGDEETTNRTGGI